MSDSEPSYQIGSSIPVVRMLEEADSKAFYLDYLGYSIDWEHRFGDNSPLYMQIRLGDSVIHLDGHANEDSPTVEVRVPVVGIDEFCADLQSRAAKLGLEQPVIVDPRYEGRGTDLNLLDPAGNIVVCWRRDDLQ